MEVVQSYVVSIFLVLSYNSCRGQIKWIVRIFCLCQSSSYFAYSLKLNCLFNYRGKRQSQLFMGQHFLWWEKSLGRDIVNGKNSSTFRTKRWTSISAYQLSPQLLIFWCVSSKGTAIDFFNESSVTRDKYEETSYLYSLHISHNTLLNEVSAG